ncbi:MAG: chemotaxis protein CheB [Bacteroidota bacterium]
MLKRNIIVIGASAGGFEALKQLAAGLPPDLDAAIFVVWHMSPDVRGILPQVLNKQNTLLAAHAYDKEPIKPGRIYVAPPDHHMLIDNDRIRLSKGPKENHFRPAVDPLFRSAAYHYASRVIGVVLSGALDDGSAGLWTVKQYGGLAVVQDPHDADVPSMPQNAMRAVAIDHVAAISEMASLLTRLSQQEAGLANNNDMNELRKTKLEIGIALEDGDNSKELFKTGELTPYTCPECHGTLAAIKEGNGMRFRCHTGHAFSADSLLTLLTENVGDLLWTTIRSMQESIALLNHMGDHFAEANARKEAALYFRKANEVKERLELVRKAVLAHEQLTMSDLNYQAQQQSGSEGHEDV